MATASISGLSSGLDTATIISQLMQLEAASQTRLKTRVGTEQSRVTALQGINTRLAALATAAKEMAAPAVGATSVWQSLSATSSHAAVSVVASSAASPSTFSVDVVSTARAHRVAFAGAHPQDAVVTGGATTVELDRLDGSAPVVLDVGTGTLAEVAAAINHPGNATGLRAAMVQVSPGSYRLLVESARTGAAEDFALSLPGGAPLLGGAATVQAARDAEISIGGIAVRSTTNTFTDVVPGVTITLSPTATGTADVAVTRDATTRSAAVKKMVDDINGLLSTIATQTAYNPTSGASGVLGGSSGVRALATSLLQTIYPGGGGTLASYGIELDRHGKLVFDEKDFSAAFAADPEAVSAAFVGPGGFVARVQGVAERASDPHAGSITSLIKSSNDGIKRLNDSIAAWDDRLALRRATLERQYTALEVAMSRLQSQSSWLAGQLASLDNDNGS